MLREKKRDLGKVIDTQTIHTMFYYFVSRKSVYTICLPICHWISDNDCNIFFLTDCPNCIDDSQVASRWTMPLLKLGEKRYYLGVFFKVNPIRCSIDIKEFLLFFATLFYWYVLCTHTISYCKSISNVTKHSFETLRAHNYTPNGHTTIFPVTWSTCLE